MEEGDKTVEAVKAQANALEEEAAELARQEQVCLHIVRAASVPQLNNSFYSTDPSVYRTPRCGIRPFL